MEMIWLNSKGENGPSLLFALCFKKFLATVFEFADKNGLSSLGTPDKMIDNEVYSVLISLICKLALFCRFHSRNYTANSISCQQKGARAPGLLQSLFSSEKGLFHATWCSLHDGLSSSGRGGKRCVLATALMLSVLYLQARNRVSYNDDGQVIYVFEHLQEVRL